MSSEFEFAFGSFRLCTRRRLLLDAGRPVRIGGRALDLLTLLLERAGQVVGKDELIARAWPRAVVEETSLRFHITTLRRLLGEGRSEGARFIANISGRGYCFVAQVARVGPETPSADLPSDQPPAAPPPATPHNLPARLSRIVGRDALLAELRRELPARRLLTIVGPGGMGKSTLALALAESLLTQYPHGVWFVDLSTVADPALVPSAVATALGLGVDPKHALAHLIAALQNRRLLIVLDNCEHVVGQAAELAAALLAGLRELHLIATSREALQCPQERPLRLAPLDTPPADPALSADAALRHAAVQLFVERARAGLEGFALRDEDAGAAAAICRRLDGMPLAIELAAARVDSFGVPGLLAQLDQHLPLLASHRRGVPERHQTLEGLLDWSYRMLSPAEQQLLRRLAIFSGSFDPAALQRVLPPDAAGSSALMPRLAVLVNRSLVSVDVRGPAPRYRLLDTTRLYALAKLARSAEHRQIRRLHAVYLCECLRPSAADWVCLPRRDLMRRYAHLGDEVRASLHWAFGADGDAEVGLRLLVAAGPLGHLVTHPEEFIGHTERALSTLDAQPRRDPALEQSLWFTLGGLRVLARGSDASAAAAFARANALARAAGDEAGLARQLLWNFADSFGAADYRQALLQSEAYAAVLPPEADESARLAAVRTRALCLHFVGRHQEAEEAARLIVEHPSPVIRVGPGYPFDRRVSMNVVLARTRWLQGRSDQAFEAVRAAIDYAAPEIPVAMFHALAWAAVPIALWDGDLEQARHHTEQLREHALQHLSPYWRGWAEVYGAVLDSLEPGGAVVRGFLLPANAAAESAKVWDMLATFGEPFLMHEAVGRAESGAVAWCAPEVWRALGTRSERTARGSAQAMRFYQRAFELAQAQGARAWQLRAATDLARLHLQAGRPGEAFALLEPLCRAYEGRPRNHDLDAALALLSAGSPARPPRTAPGTGTGSRGPNPGRA